MSNKKKIKWKVVSKKGENFENFFLSIVADTLAPALIIKTRPLQLITSAYLQIDGNRYFLMTDLIKHINKLIHLLKNNPQIIINEYRHYEYLLDKMRLFADNIPQKNFYKLDLINYLRKWSSYISVIQYGYNYYFLNQPVADVILKALERNKVQNVFSSFEILSQAKKLSVIQQEKMDILKLVRKIKDNKLKFNSPLFNRKIRSHLDKYAFMGMFYFRGKPWQIKDVLFRLRFWLKNDWQKELKNLSQLKEANKETGRLIRKYQFSPYEKKLITIMKEMAYATNLYDEVHNYFAYKSRPLLHYIARKIGVNYTELIEISFSELLDLLKSNKKVSQLFRKILRQRDKESALITTQGKTKILIGEKVSKFFKKEVGEEKVIHKDVLKGQCACAGQALGKVVVFKTVSDIPRVKKGNVMVAFTTVPSFVPAMEKASAIVTEMGGLLSHAAIVSRELQVPCVVGVDNATKILEDGDLVEIDAAKGVVKRLN